MLQGILIFGLALLFLPMLMLTYLAFKQSFLWGISCFFISPIPFSIVYWRDNLKYVWAMIIGLILTITTSYVGTFKPDEREIQTAVNAVYKVLNSQIDSGKLDKYNSEIGYFMECNESSDISYSVGFAKDYPIEWTGEVNCQFTKSEILIEVLLKQSGIDSWEHLDSIINIK